MQSTPPCPLQTWTSPATAAQLAKPLWNCSHGQPQQYVPLADLGITVLTSLSRDSTIETSMTKPALLWQKLHISIHILIFPSLNNCLTHRTISSSLHDLFLSAALLNYFTKLLQVQTNYVSWLVYTVILLFLHVQEIKFYVPNAYGKTLDIVPFVTAMFFRYRSHAYL